MKFAVIENLENFGISAFSKTHFHDRSITLVFPCYKNRIQN